MLEIVVPEREFYDSEANVFLDLPEQKLRLEHSLVSLSKWESFWEKPFISTEEKTVEETLWYIKAMTLDENIPDLTYKNLTPENLEQINVYINAKMTATWFTETQNRSFSSEVVTSELIYYWMVAFQIPFECQYWHLARLLTLIRVCEHKNRDPKKNKMSKSQMMARRRALNEQRMAQYNTRG